MAKKRPGTFRTTISVPRDLKRRMDESGEDINWSALACKAFQEKLAEIAARKESKNPDDVIERLRASKERSDSGAYREGFAAGQAWASNTAEAIELERVDKLHQRLSEADWKWWFASDDNNTYSPAELFVFIVRPENEQDRAYAESFWRELGRDYLQIEDEWMRGFAEGALEVWKEVKSKL